MGFLWKIRQRDLSETEKNLSEIHKHNCLPRLLTILIIKLFGFFFSWLPRPLPFSLSLLPPLIYHVFVAQMATFFRNSKRFFSYFLIHRLALPYMFFCYSAHDVIFSIRNIIANIKSHVAPNVCCARYFYWDIVSEQIHNKSNLLYKLGVNKSIRRGAKISWENMMEKNVRNLYG